MDNRLVAAAVIVTTLGAAGCASQPPALGGTTAKVTINGQSTGAPLPVTCSQAGFLWTIATTNEDKGFTAALETGDEVKVESVDFRDLGGFTGTFWRDNIGNAEVTGTGGTFTITGEADGSFTDNPNSSVTATFRIEADC